MRKLCVARGIQNFDIGIFCNEFSHLSNVYFYIKYLLFLNNVIKNSDPLSIDIKNNFEISPNFVREC